MKKRKRNSVPIMLLWSKRDQARFIDAVERMQSLVNDLERVLLPAKRRRAAADARAAAAAAANGSNQP